MLDSLRRLLTQLLALLRVRLELLSAELSSEFHRIVRAIVWALAALLFASIGLLMAAITVVIAFWEQDRLVASLWVTGGFVLVALLAVWQSWRTLARGPKLFAATLEELRRDREALMGSNGNPNDKHPNHKHDEQR